MFDSWPENAKQRSSAEKMIREYLSSVTVKSLFLISRKNDKDTYESRYYETNPNGLCGSIYKSFSTSKKASAWLFSHLCFCKQSLRFS